MHCHRARLRGGHRQPVAGQGGAARWAASGCGWDHRRLRQRQPDPGGKAFEASKALEQGANQIDCVLNAGAMLSGDDEIVYNDMLAVVDMAHSALAVAGVIVAIRPMSDDLVSRAAGSPSAPAPTTWSPRGARCRHGAPWAALLRDSVGLRVQVKASGRFRTLADVRSAAAAALRLLVSADAGRAGQRCQ